jgi:hypothetical protein
MQAAALVQAVRWHAFEEEAVVIMQAAALV